MKKEKIEEALKTLKKEESLFLSEVKAYVQDLSIPLNDRWEVFCMVGESKIIPSNKYLFEPKGLNWDKLDFFEDFYLDRYQQYYANHILEQAVEDKLFVDEEKDVALFKESWIEEFVFSATLDW